MLKLAGWRREEEMVRRGREGRRAEQEKGVVDTRGAISGQVQFGVNRGLFVRTVLHHTAGKHLPRFVTGTVAN